MHISGITITVKGGALPAGLADTLRTLGADVAGSELLAFKRRELIFAA